MKRKKVRNKKGAFSAVLLLLTTLGLLMIGGVAIDLSHAFYVRSQLQAAADSCALTGAYYLSNLHPSTYDHRRSEEMARQIARRNFIDGYLMDDAGDRTELVYSCQTGFKGPQFCQITLTHKVCTSFGRLVGVNYLPVTVVSKAGAFVGTKSVAPNWLQNLAISHRVLRSREIITDPQNKEFNSYFVSEWKSDNNPDIKVGATIVTAGKGDLNSLQARKVYNVAIVRGGDPKESMPRTSEIIGTVSIMLDVRSSADRSTFRIVEGGVIKGQPGTPRYSGFLTSDDMDFAIRNGHWRVALVQ
jgi:Flp pilus assembly protein TadG